MSPVLCLLLVVLPVGMAYDDTLRACCRAVGLEAPERSPLSSIHRLQTEAALAQAGVTW